MKRVIALCLILLSIGMISLLGCSEKKPEGPAERIGRGVDEILGGMRDLDEQSGESSSRSSSDSWRTSEGRDDGYIPSCDPRFDPKCDDPYWKNQDNKTR